MLNLASKCVYIALLKAKKYNHTQERLKSCQERKDTIYLDIYGKEGDYGIREEIMEFKNGNLVAPNNFIIIDST